MNNNVEHPSHYNQGGVECIEAIKAATIGKTGVEAFCVGNTIKYLFRYEAKNGLEDVKKAQWYINRLIQELEAKDSQEETATIDTKTTKPSRIELIDEKYPPFDGISDEVKCTECKYLKCSTNQLPCSKCRFGNAGDYPLRFSPKSS